jgi:hypothetical protein
MRVPCIGDTITMKSSIILEENVVLQPSVKQPTIQVFLPKVLRYLDVEG